MNWANFIPGILLSIIALMEFGLFFYFLRYEKTHSIRAYLIFIAGVIIWVGSNGISLLVGEGDVTFGQKFAYLGGTIIATSFLYFIHSFPHPLNRTIFWLRHLWWVSAIVFGYLLFFTNTFLERQILLNDGVMQTSPGAALWVWSIFFLIVWGFGLAELIRRFRLFAGMDRIRLRYLLVGVTVSLFVGIITDVILPLTSVQHFAWEGPLLSVIWLWFSVRAVRV
ncbi:MAG: hypothetical protein HY340_02415 [Candidatus Kerfeldbacteria bacterium]|nr:hypothetical protein [Candidatus Kerfeldbacteria bacterium]